VAKLAGEHDLLSDFTVDRPLIEAWARIKSSQKKGDSTPSASELEGEGQPEIAVLTGAEDHRRAAAGVETSMPISWASI
jgi:hypothetical protein